ncbi:hypothetical protein AOZ07_15675 [Glutamicibacter halophytocola]|nr:hypothetical protein AOZ07_15675 [Glutamicibacter halophytocola]
MDLGSNLCVIGQGQLDSGSTFWRYLVCAIFKLGDPWAIKGPLAPNYPVNLRKIDLFNNECRPQWLAVTFSGLADWNGHQLRSRV